MRGRRSLLNLKAQIVELRKSTSKSKEDQALLTKLVFQYRAELAKSKAAKAKADAEEKAVAEKKKKKEEEEEEKKNAAGEGVCDRLVRSSCSRCHH